MPTSTARRLLFTAALAAALLPPATAPAATAPPACDGRTLYAIVYRLHHGCTPACLGGKKRDFLRCVRPLVATWTQQGVLPPECTRAVNAWVREVQCPPVL